MHLTELKKNFLAFLGHFCTFETRQIFTFVSLFLTRNILSLQTTFYDEYIKIQSVNLIQLDFLVKMAIFGPLFTFYYH